jgi:putative protease
VVWEVMKIKKPEILSPAGDLERLKIALEYGADAVYLGGKSFGMRAFAPNFDEEELKEGISFAHSRNAKVYVTVNNLMRNQELDDLLPYLQTLAKLEVDAVILSDPGVLSLIKEHLPELCCHLSTQASTLNWRAARFWKNQGIQRIILARELSMTEIAEIKEKVDVELEVFVHGAMCVAYSGRCLLSSYFTGRSANSGACTQSCRWKYYLQEAKRPGEKLPIIEDENGSYILSAYDLCMIQHIPELVSTGVDAFKIEGRMKSVHYVATVTRAYLLALDAYMQNPDSYSFNPYWREELEKVSHRPYGTGFYYGRPKQVGAGEGNYLRNHMFVGLVKNYDANKKLVKVEQRNRFVVGDCLEIVGPNDETPYRFVVDKIYDEKGNTIDAAPHPKQIVYLPLDRAVPVNSLVRRPEAKDGALKQLKKHTD